MKRVASMSSPLEYVLYVIVVLVVGIEGDELVTLSNSDADEVTPLFENEKT
jgi:hypothetical protein